MNNPLVSSRHPAPSREDPMLRHAQMWQQAHSMPSDDLTQHIQTADYALPIFAALLANPKVTAKDVIKVTSGAVADGKISPSQGVQTITNMPADADKLRPWLREMYSNGLTMAVHAKAALLNQAQTVPQIPGGVPNG
jgi:hypothetical protein